MYPSLFAFYRRNPTMFGGTFPDCRSTGKERRGVIGAQPSPIAHQLRIGRDIVDQPPSPDTRTNGRRQGLCSSWNWLSNTRRAKSRLASIRSKTFNWNLQSFSLQTVDLSKTIVSFKMAAFEDQSSVFENPRPSFADDNLVCHDTLDGTYYGLPYHAAVHKDETMVPHVEHSDITVNDCPDVFEFFDLERATMDTQILPHETQTTSPVTSATLKSPVPFFASSNEPLRHDSAEALPEMEAIPWKQQLQTLPRNTVWAHPFFASVHAQYSRESSGTSRHGKRFFQEDPTDTFRLVMVATNKPAERQKLTEKQLNSVKSVRAHRPCLRCFMQKIQCSEGWQCKACQKLFAGSNRTRQWTRCVTLGLPELNIIAIAHCSNFFKDLTLRRQRTCSHYPSDLAADRSKIAITLYKLLFGSGILSVATNDIGELYTKVLQHTHGHHATDVHSFVATERTPLRMLIRLNVILLGSPGIAPDLVSRVRFFQKLRAICAVVAFECLGKALDRSALAGANSSRQCALIVEVSLLLEQVIAMDLNLPSEAIFRAQGAEYEEMRKDLIQYLSSHLQN
ncbi:hypothetical protein EK21DRAFT_95366 [Setomelanomma holmii]|uniref:Uncharacterized protein n=1 Tax=Setomelanomma holmii TaxID=210430 RepID=A0A9P4LE52_9PLEO|nr:hypothetical protein EK21DRAFT_95366 [Setomelanomma holmii]